ncbi:MAG TPA: penicillin acylase family protein [Chitinophagaceae bacterium]|nr:penicillin acylase family protein [Chitinophagaceae bacterium]
MGLKAAYTSVFLLLALLTTRAQVDASKIDIVRDKWGVPHIFANTDAEVAYGLAYAHAEDDFETIQNCFLAGKAMLGRLKGKDGAAIDYVVHLLRIPQLVDDKYNTISPAYKKVLEGYCAGFNAYAKTHAKDVLVKQLLPLTPKDMLCYSVLQLCISSGVDDALKSILGGRVATISNLQPGGSNGFAFNSKITADGQTYLAINSHQPLEGPVSWYEAHLCSNEGWNIIGALFPGAPIVLHGCNQYLGWAHTVNNPDKLDIYQLEINPKNKLQYKFDGKWEKLAVSKVHLNVKIAGITIGVTKDAYWCKYGPVLMTKKGTFAIRTPAMFDIRGTEEWYLLDKAKNFTEFDSTLQMNAIPGYNIVYADRYDTIFYISNGNIPVRDKSFNWKSTLPGNTSKTLWTSLYPVTQLPQVLQPGCGYVFNTNNTPFNATGPNDNLDARNYDQTMGYEKYDNNRSLRFTELLKQYHTISYDDFKKIKYDVQLPAKLSYMVNVDTLFSLNAAAHKDIADIISLLQEWDRTAEINSIGATVFDVIYYAIANDFKNQKNYSIVTTPKAIELYKNAKAYLMNNFKKINVPLGDYQKLVRGDKALPVGGIPDVIAAMYSVPYKDGMVKAAQGESYIELVRFTKDGPKIESVNCYGASNNKGSIHYDDQMQLFTHQLTKNMTFDKTEIYKNAERVYHPK